MLAERSDVLCGDVTLRCHCVAERVDLGVEGLEPARRSEVEPVQYICNTALCIRVEVVQQLV